jgi:hypothetical protein
MVVGCTAPSVKSENATNLLASLKLGRSRIGVIILDVPPGMSEAVVVPGTPGLSERVER